VSTVETWATEKKQLRTLIAPPHSQFSVSIVKPQHQKLRS